MLRIGITGQSGFIGRHLFNTLGLSPDRYFRVAFERSFFDDQALMDTFVGGCDVIVHLAAMNRVNDPTVLYKTNIDLTDKLIASLDRTGSRAHIIFASSIQEERDNLYGKSKKEGRMLLADWTARHNVKFTGLIIPNVFGPFGKPYYNSVVATFSHQLSHGETPVIDVDGDLKLIYVGELVKAIILAIHDAPASIVAVQHTSENKVSGILALLTKYKEEYQDKGVIPALNSRFELNLFNTFRCYMDIRQTFPVRYVQHADQRGVFVEIMKVEMGGQVSFSTTNGGITRGNHFHTRKIERFSVISGEALIQLRQIGTDEVLDFQLSGKNPAYVDMPVWYTHNIRNTGEAELYTIFWINEFYNPEDPDTYFETV